MVMKQLSAGCSRSMRPSTARVTATGDSSRRATRPRSSVADKKQSSSLISSSLPRSPSAQDGDLLALDQVEIDVAPQSRPVGHMHQPLAVDLDILAHAV